MVVSSPLYSNGLKNQSVFLSASFPFGNRADNFPQADPFEITDAVVALARSVFGARGRLVFGGHPTISPLVLSVGRDFLSYFSEQERDSLLPLVCIYQSDYFKDQIPYETLQLENEGIGKIIWVKSIKNNLAQSLLELRVKMLSEQKPIAGVFIGGMDGVYTSKSRNDEYHLFAEICDGKPVYPIGKTGGASQALLSYLMANRNLIEKWNYLALKPEELLQPVSYSSLSQKIVLDILQHKKQK
jgi:hypothetical protein